MSLVDIVVEKPPHSPTRGSNSPVQRGRRLPPVPHSSSRGEQARHSTEVNIGRSNTMPKRKKDVQYSKEKILQELGIG